MDKWIAAAGMAAENEDGDEFDAEFEREAEDLEARIACAELARGGRGED